MQNKLINLFKRNARFGLKYALILAVIPASALLWRLQKAQVLELAKVREERRLVGQLPEFEKQIQRIKLQDLSQEPRGSEKITKKDLAIKGVFMKDNLCSVLIGDTFYQKGDTFGDFQILELNLNYIVIQDKNTKQSEKLYFSD
jgi:hypothetical protein